MDFEEEEEDKSFEVLSGSSSESVSDNEEDEEDEFNVSSDSESEEVSEIAVPNPPASLIIGQPS